MVKRRQPEGPEWIPLAQLRVVDLDGARELRGRLGFGQIRVIRDQDGGGYRLEVSAVPRGHAVREHDSFVGDDEHNCEWKRKPT